MKRQFNKLTTFHGDGGNLFGLYITNVALCIVTLGLYYPWARAAMLRYTYQETEFAGSRFTFHGKGEEMFMGMLKGVGIVFAIQCLFLFAGISGSGLIFGLMMLAYLAGMVLIIPVALHGALRYRLSRSSWRGIHFAYDGELGGLISEFVAGLMLTIFTFGIYNAWFTVNLRTYIIDRIRLGDARFSFVGSGTDFFALNIKGYFLTLFTFGIYYFWWRKEIMDYYIEHTEILQGEQTVRLRSTLKGGDYFLLMLTNILLLVLTLGLASPWITVRTLRFMLDGVAFEDNLDVDAIEQGDYQQVRNDDIADILNIDFS